MRMTNLTGKDGTQFNVWSRDTHEDGVFTSENGYYTVFADVRADTSSGEAGDDFSHMWNQPFHVVGGTAESSSSAKFNLTEEFTTKEMLLYREGAEGLRRHRYIFNYTTGATKAGVDKFDIDNLKMYFKPLSVDVTVLAGDNADFEAQKVTVAIDKDTLNSTITKAKLMALVENDTDLVLGDLTLSDGSAFEEIDVMKVTEVKAVWLSKAPQSYDVSSIRVKDPSGIRFKASVSDVLRANESLTEYGFIVTLKDLLGETDVNDFTHKTEVSKVEGKSYSKEENIDKVFATENSLTFFTAVLYNMPETQYARDVVVRPYTVVNDEYVYGDAMVNNIKAVAEKLQQDPEKYVGDVKIAVDKILAGEKL